MYLEPTINITKGSDGTFIIQYKVKRKKDKKDKAEILPRYVEKTVTASNTNELMSKLEKIIAKLPKDTEEEEFNEAFAED